MIPVLYTGTTISFMRNLVVDHSVCTGGMWASTAQCIDSIFHFLISKSEGKLINRQTKKSFVTSRSLIGAAKPSYHCTCCVDVTTLVRCSAHQGSPPLWPLRDEMCQAYAHAASTREGTQEHGGLKCTAVKNNLNRKIMLPEMSVNSSDSWLCTSNPLVFWSLYCV